MLRARVRRGLSHRPHPGVPDRVATPRGELRTYRITKIPMRLDDDGVTHVITIGEDVTDWTRGAGALRASRRSSQRSASSPPASCTRSTIRSPRSPPAPRASRCSARGPARRRARRSRATATSTCKIIDNEVQRCKRSSTDSSISAGRSRRPSERVDINEVVEQTLFLLKHHVRFKKLKVQTQLDPRSIAGAGQPRAARAGLHGAAAQCRWTPWASAGRSPSARAAAPRHVRRRRRGDRRRARAFARASCARSSNRSTRRSRRGRGPDWGCRSATASSRNTADASRSTVLLELEARSASCSRSGGPRMTAARRTAVKVLLAEDEHHLGASSGLPGGARLRGHRYP